MNIAMRMQSFSLAMDHLLMCSEKPLLETPFGERVSQRRQPNARCVASYRISIIFETITLATTKFPLKR